MSDLLYFYINRYLAKCQPKTAAAKLNNFKMFWMKKQKLNCGIFSDFQIMTK